MGPCRKSKVSHRCAICLEPLDNSAEALVCAHVFHESCIRDTGNNGKKYKLDTCPICRYELKQKSRKCCLHFTLITPNNK